MEVKDLREVIAIKTDYREINAWLEWIKYFIHTKQMIATHVQ
jgi:hypothetical protein